MKTISVLIAAYKAQLWLHDCLYSVLNQQLPAGWQLEVLLGVDGCSDTAHIAKSIASNKAHSQLEIIVLKQNLGTYIAFNTLAQLAKGELICRFDADDVMKPNYLAAQITAMAEGADATATWSIYTDPYLQPTSYVPAHEVRYPPTGENPKATDGQIVLRRKVLDKLGSYRGWRFGADTDFLNRFRCAGFRYSVVEDFLYFRRTHENSLIAHPESNFKSVARKSIQQTTRDYFQLYQQNKKSLYVEPEVSVDYVRI